MRDDLLTLLELIRGGRLWPVVDRELPLDDVNEAFRAAPRLSAEDIQAHFDGSPFMSFLGLRVAAVDHERGELTVTMPMRPEIERRVGTAQFHGGPIAAFIDCVGDFAVALVVGGGVPTINIRIDYLKPAVGAAITGTARVRRSGRTVTVVDIDVHDAERALVAVGRGTYSSQRG